MGISHKEGQVSFCTICVGDNGAFVAAGCSICKHVKISGAIFIIRQLYLIYFGFLRHRDLELFPKHQEICILFFYYKWINKLFSERTKVPQHCWKLERWQGPPHINKVKQHEIVLSFKVRLLIQLISHENKEGLCILLFLVETNQPDFLFSWTFLQ